jgi:hypothetical protein
LVGFAGQTYIAIEVLGNLLKGSVAGLDVEEVNDDQLDRKPDVVHDVVLPLDVAQSDRVDILVAVDLLALFGSGTKRWTYKNRAMSTMRNMRVMPLARML